MRHAILSCFALLILVAGAALGADEALFSVSVEALEDLRLMGVGSAVVRHIGRTEAIVQGGEELGSELRSRGRTCERICSMDETEALYVCYTGGPDFGDLDRLGRVLWSEHAGAALVSARDDQLHGIMAECFMVHPLAESVDIENWFDNTPAPLVGTRTDARESSVRGIVEDVVQAVSADSLTSYVERLSQYPDETLRSRFMYRGECLTEAKPYLMNKLRSFLPPGSTIDTLRFDKLGYRCDYPESTRLYHGDNVAGILEGTGRLQGYYVVCGHYDAIAVRSFPGQPMWWCDNPAPGADDNGTGAAVVLETARVLSQLSNPEPVFPFDIRFLLFSGEELFLLGSTAYAESVAALNDTIYGVINVDMIGLELEESNPDSTHIVTNPGTRWLAEWLAETVDLYEVEIGDTIVDNPLGYSDHGSFWAEGYDALIAIEHWEPRDRNPYYHTVDDVPSTVSPSQVEGVTKMVAAALARFDDQDAVFNVAVHSGDFSFDPEVLSTSGSTEVTMEVHVFGPEEQVGLTLEIWDGAPDEGELLSATWFTREMGGGETLTHSFVWDFDEMDVGGHRVYARVTVEGAVELTEADNIASTTLSVTAPELFVVSHFPWPNPYPGAAPDADELSFEYELSREAGVKLEVFDLLGQMIVEFSQAHDTAASDEENIGTLAGWNRVGWERLRGSSEYPASGIYIYVLSIYEPAGADEPSDVVTGKIALVR